MTVTAWVQWNRTPGDGDDGANIVSNNAHNSSDQGQFWLQHNQTNTLFEFAIYGTTRSFVYSTTQPREGVWYHVAPAFMIQRKAEAHSKPGELKFM